MRSRDDRENLVVLTMFQIERFLFEMNSSSVCMLFVLSASNCKGPDSKHGLVFLSSKKTLRLKKHPLNVYSVASVSPRRGK